MKLLNVNIALNSRQGGGSAERTYQMSRYFSQNGIDCSVLTLNLGLTDDFVKSLKGIRLFVLPCLSERFFLPSFSLNSLRTIKRAVEEADIVHMMGHWSIINSLAYVFVRILKKKYVFCPAGTLIIHGRSRLFKKIYNLIIGHEIVKNAEYVIASTHDEQQKIAKKYSLKNEIPVIQNGIAKYSKLKLDGMSFRDKYNLGSKPFIVFIGTFSSIKGPDLLIKAFDEVKGRIPSYHLVLAGLDRGMLSEIKEYVKKNNLIHQVSFVGYIGGLDKMKAYCESSLLVVPSRSEVISMVALEAGALETPVLITDRCGFNEVKSLGGGDVVSASIEGISQGLVGLLSKPEKLKEMGKKLNQYVETNFTWDVITKKYIELYCQIIENKK